MKRLNTTSTLGLLIFALTPACSDDDGVTITEVDGGSRESDDGAGDGDTDKGNSPTQGQNSHEGPDASEGNGTDATTTSDGGTPPTLDGATVPPSEGDGGSVDSADADVSVSTGELDTTSAPPDENALYAFGAQVYDGNTWLTYVATSSRLDTHVTLDDAVEIQGRALAVGPEGLGVTYVTNGTTITRYRLNDSDVLEPEAPTLSFAGVGVTDIHEYGGQFVFKSASKAYFFDGDNSQVVVWNPEELTVGQPIPLDILPPEVEGVIITSSAAPIVDGSRVITFVGLRQSVVPTTPAVVVVLDTEDDTAEVVTDDRCGYVRDGVLASDGWVYLATEAYASAYQRINEADEIAEPCLLRFDPVEKVFDSKFRVELKSLFDGDVAGSLLVAKDGSAYLKVLDETVQPITAESNARVTASAPAWRWASLSVGNSPTGSLLDLPHTSGSVTPFTLGNRRIASTNRQAQVNGSTITVSDLSRLDSAPSEVIGTVDGLVFSVTKLR